MHFQHKLGYLDMQHKTFLTYNKTFLNIQQGYFNKAPFENNSQLTFVLEGSPPFLRVLIPD